jgi:hypothetical protein
MMWRTALDHEENLEPGKDRQLGPPHGHSASNHSTGCVQHATVLANVTAKPRTTPEHGVAVFAPSIATIQAPAGGRAQADLSQQKSACPPVTSQRQLTTKSTHEKIIKEPSD